MGHGWAWTRFTYDGETVEVVEMKPSAAGNEVVVRCDRPVLSTPALKELLFSDRARLIPDMAGPSSDDTEELAAVVGRADRIRAPRCLRASRPCAKS